MKLYLGILGTLAILLLAGCILLNGLSALVFIFRKNENKKADYFYATLLVTFGLTCLHQVFMLQGIYAKNSDLLFLPIYMTLSLGPALFFSVKLFLFPKYKIIGTDAKHFVLPIGQVIYFTVLFFLFSPEFREEWGRKFFSPFYGGLEMGIYIATFYAYLFGAYRYTQFQISTLRKKQMGGQPLFEAFVLRRMLRILIILFWINSAYIVTDFVMYELMNLDMHNFRGFTSFGHLSFVAMAGWIGLNGVLLLLKLPYLNSSSIAFGLAKRFLKK
jgi:hypothetical protein